MHKRGEARAPMYGSEERKKAAMQHNDNAL